MSGPLDGFRVVDFTAMMAGPFATMILAELGADVIKVEPVQGDLLRYIGTSRRGTSAIFINSNRAKRSLAVDLKAPRGAALVQQLVRTSDVVTQNFRPGVAERLGLGYQQVRDLNPSVVYASATGFGKQGPFAARRAYDPLIQAYSGIAAVQGRGRSTGPEAVRTLLGDKIAPVLLANAITAALLERERSGQGQLIETSMLHSLVWWLWADVIDGGTFVDDDGVVPGPQFANMRTVYETADGHIAVAVTTDDEWQAFTRAAEAPELSTDPRFVENAIRTQHVIEMYDTIASVVKERTTADWIERFAAADAGFAPVNEPTDVLADAQIRAIGAVTDVDDPWVGRLRIPTNFASFSRTPARAASAPALGQHTLDILRELDLPDEEISALERDGVVALANKMTELV